MGESEPVRALNLALPEQLNFIKCYKNLPPKPPCTVRFFLHGEFYTIHEDDIAVAQEKANVIGHVKHMGEAPKLNYLCVNKMNFEKFVRDLLLILQHRVEVYVRKSATSWILEYKGSPGNFSQFEEILYGNIGNNDNIVNTAIMAVKFSKNKSLALACINTTEASFYLTEFQDNDFFTELEAIIAQINPKECIIPKGETPDLIKLATVIDRNGVLVNRVNKSEFTHSDAAQDLNKLIYFADGQMRNYMVFPDLSNDHTVDSLQAVITYLKLVADDANHNQYKVLSLDVHRFVRLDNAAMTALNILPQYNSASDAQSCQKKFDNIFGILDCCATQQGRRMLEKWLRKPLRDIHKINERLDIVEALIDAPETRSVLKMVNLTRFTDMVGLCRKLGSKKATLLDLYKVFQCVNNLENLAVTLIESKNKVIKTILLDPLKDLLNDMDKFQSLVEQTIDIESADKGQFLVKPNFDEDLKDLFQRKQKIDEKMQQCLSKASHNLGFDSKQVKLDFVDHLGYIFRVATKDEADLRRNKEFIIVDAIKGAVRFRNKKLEDLNNSYLELKDHYEIQQTNIIKEIVDVASGYADTLRHLNDFIATFDVYVAMATVSADTTIPFVRPKMLPMGSGILKMRKVRHPCLEKLNNISVIPNDIDMSRDEEDGYTAVIITGPNMGGKSTYIRSIGISVLLAHIGCFVPCETADISIVDCILARIGAEDCESKGMSTFMLEMVETNSILRSATANSLAIIDELGRGTSTYDGYGIASSVIEHITGEVKCFALFATHFHEITGIAEEGGKVCKGVINRHVAVVVTNDTIIPLYKVCDGPSDKSYGIQCARIADFPEDVLKFAKQFQENLELKGGFQHIENFECDIKRQIIAEGDKEILDVVKDLQKYDVTKLNNNDVEKLYEDAIRQLMESKNIFVNTLLVIGENN